VKLGFSKNLMYKETDLFHRRLIFITAIFLLLAMVCFARLFQKQVLEHKSYLAMAKNQYFTQKDIPAKRGKIFAKEGVTTVSELGAKNKGLFPLATDIQEYQILAVPKNIKNREDTALKLSAILGMSKDEIFAQINNNKPYIPPLAKHLNKDKADQVAALNITGVLTATEQDRYYPEGSLAAHILGFVNFEGQGNYGLEGFYNDELKGFIGNLLAEKDTKGRFISIEGETAAQNGTDLVLTIDHNIQYMVEEKLKEGIKQYGAEGGTIIVQNPKTGAILAMASQPSFDPNQFNQVPQEQQNVFSNPAIASSWEPGSVFKPIVMAAALDTGTVEPDTQGVFSNMTTVQGYEIHTAQDKAFGRETMTQVLENSDNVAMVWVSEKLGKDNLYKYVRDFGFGDASGIDLQGEAKGEVSDLKQWRDINRATISFGQGIAVTPVQLISAISTIANGGKLMKPYIVDKMVRYDGKEIITEPKQVRQVIKEETAQKLTAMLVSVVAKGHGKKAGVEGYKIAGKTGTAQIPNSSGGYEEKAHIGSFAGFFPADNPQISILVKFIKPKNVEWAESSAAPVFGQLADWLISYYQIPPTPPASL